MALTVGDQFPGIVVPVQQGVSALPGGETIDLSKTDGKWKVVFFWPKDFTFICPTEIIGYGELVRDFADRDAVLIGASTDTDFVHFAWRKSDERLANCDFPWIADNKKELSNALGIIDKDAGVALRATFIVDPHNVIQHVTVNASTRPQPGRGDPRARRAADGRALPLQLAEGRRGAQAGG